MSVSLPPSGCAHKLLQTYITVHDAGIVEHHIQLAKRLLGELDSSSHVSLLHTGKGRNSMSARGADAIAMVRTFETSTRTNSARLSPYWALISSATSLPDCVGLCDCREK